MNRNQFVVLFVLSTMGITVVGAQETVKAGGGFTVVHRAQVPNAPDLEIVMGMLERDRRSTSSKHYHPGGEFGFVVEGAVTITSENHDVVTLEAGSSFHQPPGEWHVVSTGAEGTKTVLFRVLEKGDPMVVEVD